MFDMIQRDKSKLSPTNDSSLFFFFFFFSEYLSHTFIFKVWYSKFRKLSIITRESQHYDACHILSPSIKLTVFYYFYAQPNLDDAIAY